MVQLWRWIGTPHGKLSWGVLAGSERQGPPPPDAFSDPVTLDKFENHCEMVLVKAKKGVLAPLGKDMVAVARDVVSRGSPRPKPPPPPGPSPRQQQRLKTPTPDISVESEEEEARPPANAVQALVDEDLASKVREQEAQLRELQEKLRESERRVSAKPRRRTRKTTTRSRTSRRARR